MNISELINQLISVKQQRTELAAKDSELSKEVSRLEADIMHAMTEAGTTKAASPEGHSAAMNKKTHPVIVDWNAFYEYVAKSQSFDLLHKRLSSTAFKDRWESGEVIPGTSTSEVWELSVRASRN
jgi:hypothetical protein